jgi:predicted GIY-YIG superfamily endonuclease
MSNYSDITQEIQKFLKEYCQNKEEARLEFMRIVKLVVKRLAANRMSAMDAEAADNIKILQEIKKNQELALDIAEKLAGLK